MNDQFNDDNQHNYYGERKRLDFPRRDHSEHSVTHNNNHSDKEEYASEISPTASVGPTNWDTTEHRDNRSEGAEAERADTDVADNSIGRTVGYVGVGLGIASLFLWSIVLGPLAAVLGFYAYSQGAKTSGGWSIGLGIVATLSYFFLIPFTR